MKKLATTTLMMMLSFLGVTTYAQQPDANRSSPVKPSLFSKFPDVITCTTSQLNSFFAGKQDQNINVSFNNILTLEGSVKSNLVKYSNLQTVIIKLPAFNNISFSLSKRTDEQNNIVYTGHLFDSAFADGYELKKADKENYQLIKISMEKILPTCSQ